MNNYDIGEEVLCWNNVDQYWERATIKNIRYNIASSFDNYIYPVLYDVLFESGRYSTGHFESSLQVLTI